MTQERSLLSFVAQRHTKGLEDAATDALFFILSRSCSAKQALSEFLGDELGPMPITKAQTWMTDEHGATPDLACVDEYGDRVALIESKFWASLTYHQPVTYWQSLPADKRAVLLFLAPDYRVEQGILWDELKDKLSDAGHKLCPDVGDRDQRVITARSIDGQRRLMLTTWQLLLDRMAQRASEKGDTQACFEIAELQGLAASAIEDDKPTQDENLKQLIAEAVQNVEQSKWADTHGLSVGSGFDYYGRYLRLAGAFAWLGIDYKAVKQMPDRPLWLSFSGDYEIDVTVKLEEVRSRLKDEAETGLEWRSGEIYLPIDLPPGADRDKTLAAMVAELERIAELIDPEGPTYL